MQKALIKSLIFHAVLLIIIILSTLSIFGRKDTEPAITAITVEMLPVKDKMNIPKAQAPAPKKPKPKEKAKPKPVSKPKPKKEEPKKPEPKPAEKPQEKEKPKEKPQEKPKEEVKEEPKKEEPKKEEKKENEELDSLLKSLEEQEQTAQEITQNEAEFDPSQEMSITEVQAIVGKITKQIQQCWNVPAGARNAAELIVSVDIDIERDGTVKFIGFTDGDKLGADPFYQVAADSARRAVLDPRCNPLREIPPLDKYEIWRELTIEFNPENQIY